MNRNNASKERREESIFDSLCMYANERLKKEAETNAQDFVDTFTRSGSTRLNVFLSPQRGRKYVDLFCYRRLFVSSLFQKLFKKGDQKFALNLLTHFLDSIFKRVQESAFDLDVEPRTAARVQPYFEILGLAMRYLKNDSNIPSVKELRIRTFKTVFEDFLNQNCSAIARWNNLWIMRLSFGSNDEELSDLGVGQKILNSLASLDIRKPFKQNADIELYYAALVFLIKFQLNKRDIVPEILDRIAEFSSTNPLSGFIIYAYLEHGQDRYAEFLQPLLSSIDEEPSTEGCRWSPLPFDVASRAVEAMAAFSDEKDLDRLKENGFLNIQASLYPRDTASGKLATLERMVLYAAEETVYHRKDSRSKSSTNEIALASCLRSIFEEKLPYLYDRENHCLSIYAKLYSDISRRMEIEAVAPDPTAQRHLSSAAALILNSVNKQYFKDKSYAHQKGRLRISLSELDNELRKLHDSTEKIYRIQKHLQFERNTVDVMREKIVKPYFLTRPEDLIRFAHISFSLWAKGKKLGEPDIPVFSDLIKKELREPLLRHVVMSNKYILSSIKNEWDPSRMAKAHTIKVLDIGGGVGNTTEAVIDSFPDKKMQICAVELVPTFVKHYSRRILMIMILRRYIENFTRKRTKKQPNFNIDCVNMDIHRFLKLINENEQALTFLNKDKLKTEALQAIMNDREIGIKDSAVINCLREICVNEDSVLDVLDNIKKNQDICLDVYKDYNDSLHTYSGTSLERDVNVREQVKESITNVTKKLVEYFHKIDFIPVPQLPADLREFSRKSVGELRVGRDSSTTKEEELEVKRDFDFIIANYVLHHLTMEYRQQIYKWLLDSSKNYAFFAVSDPFLGASDFNRRYFNFTDEGVFASFGDLERCVEEVEAIENENGYYWKAIDHDSDEKGFYVVFEKTRIHGAGAQRENHMSINGLSISIREINRAAEKHPELASELVSVRKKLETMKVSLIGLERLRDDLKRGNITREQCDVQSKKLRIDIERSKNEVDLLAVLHSIPDEEKKSELLQLKEAIRSNKDFIRVVLEVMKAIVKPNV